jgi:hypothetical protein
MPSAHDHCRGFSRSELLRGAAARAGRGLPDIEPGMPAPAGTGLTRRSVLLRSAGLALSIYGAQALAPRALEEGVAAAQAASAGERVLVSVFLTGGLDSMTLLAPTGDPRYAELRPTLALPAHQGTPFTEDARLRWHPSAAALATLHGEGKMTVLPAIGYASPNQSHFTSRHFWEVGATDPHAGSGGSGAISIARGAPTIRSRASRSARRSTRRSPPGRTRWPPSRGPRPTRSPRPV